MISKARNVIQKRYFLILLDQAISSGSNFILAILYARILGAEEFGKYGLILFFGYLINMIGQSVIGTTMAMNLNRYKINLFQYQIYVLLKYVFLSISVLVLVFVIDMLEYIDINVLLVYLFLVFFLLYDILKKYFFASFEIKKVLLIDCIYFSLVFIQLIFNNSNLNHIDIFMFNVNSFIIANIIGLFLIKLSFYNVKAKIIYLFLVREFKSIKHLFISSVLQWFNSRIGFYLLAYLHSAKFVGIFNGYMSIIGIFNPLFISLDSYILPRASKAYNESGTEEAKKIMDKVLNIILIPIVVLSLFLILFKDEIIFYVLGDEYLEYSFIFIFIICSYLFNFLSKRYIYMINILMKQYIFSKLYSIIFLLVSVSSYLIILKMNIYGLGLILLMISLFSFYYFRKKV